MEGIGAEEGDDKYEEGDHRESTSRGHEQLSQAVGWSSRELCCVPQGSSRVEHSTEAALVESDERFCSLCACCLCGMLGVGLRVVTDGFQVLSFYRF